MRKIIEKRNRREHQTRKKIKENEILPKIAFRFDKLREPIRQTPGKPRLRLHSHFHCLHGAECYISNEFSRSRPCKVDQGLVFCSILGSSNIRVILLEELIEAKFACPLSAVTKKRWHPAPKEAPETLLFEKDTKSWWNALVLSWINLKFQIKNFSLDASL